MMFTSETKSENSGKEKPTVMNNVFTNKPIKVQAKFVIYHFYYY